MGTLVITLGLIAAGVALIARRLGTPRRTALISEFALLSNALGAYFIVRWLTEGDHLEAVRNAHALVVLEHSAGFFVEPTLNAAVQGSGWILTAANWVYVWGHWPVIAIVAGWLYATRPSAYRFYRNAFLVSGAIGLVLFLVYPTAPPRLAGLGFIDTLAEYSTAYHVLQPPPFTNQYAAFPSLHFGWNLLVAIAIVRTAASSRARLAAWLLPVLMLAAIVVTANHYLVDAVAGGVVALAGLYIAGRLDDWYRAVFRVSTVPRVAASR